MPTGPRHSRLIVPQARAPPKTSTRAITKSRTTTQQLDLTSSCARLLQLQVQSLLLHSPVARPPVVYPAAAMNTISPPPQIKRLSGPKRFLGIVVGVTAGLGANVLLGYSVASFYTRNTKFVPYDTSSPEFNTPLFKKHNPASNPPVCIDHAVKEIPYGKLPQKYWAKGKDGRISVAQDQLATDFCRGVWGGVAYRVQRRYLERKYRALPGREEHLWDKEDLERSNYEVGTKITDHFEVVEHTPEKVIVRCGDSPLSTEPRPSDGLFAMEVSADDDAQIATFHLKSVFVNTSPGGKDSQPLPWNFQFAHRWYTKLWMESATRKLQKEA